MASMPSSFLSSLPQDHFRCPLCAGVFSDPVTTPCGHSFCRGCLDGHWDGGGGGEEPCRCPTCDKRFRIRPEISTNAVIHEVAAQIKRQRRAEAAEAAEEEAETTNAEQRVACDVCPGIKLRALKSCLVCVTSFCELHLEPHLRVPSLARHELTEPLEHLELRVCPRHRTLLDTFCRDEKVCICSVCRTEHREHDLVTLEEEGERQRGNIETKIAEIQTMIETRTEKMKEFMALSEMRRQKADKEAADSDELFTALTAHVQELQAKVKSNIQDELGKSRDQDDAAMTELQEETDELQRRRRELEELTRSQDRIHLLQASEALSGVPGLRDWSQVQVYSDLYVQTLRVAMTHLVNTFQTRLRALTDAELTRMRQYKESVTFDPETAGRNLVVSEWGKRLKHSRTAAAATSSLDGPRRFRCPMALGSAGFASGRHYWEVQVGLRADWDVGVARETVARDNTVCVKRENGFFAIGKTGLDYEAQRTPYQALHLCPRPRRLGVYVDYEGGRVSFYDVDRKLHVYSFTGESFTGKLFPYFYLYSKAKKSEPLVIVDLQARASLVSLLNSLQKAKDDSSKSN